MSRAETFWSRRRAGVEAEAEAEKAALAAEELAVEQAALDEKSDDEILAELNLPEPESLGLGDDFSVFMTKAVPDRLRRRALRVLWRSNPTLANVDMLVDYGEDFTDKATVIENMQTAYQVGKGMLKHVEEMARQAEELENPSEPEPDDVHEPDNMHEDEPEVLVAVVEDEAEFSDPDTATDVAEDCESESEDYTVPTPRRMKFRVEETT